MVPPIVDLGAKTSNVKLIYGFRLMAQSLEIHLKPPDTESDMEKDASGASTARGSFWPMRKFGTRNKKKCGKFLRKFILDVEIRPNV